MNKKILQIIYLLHEKELDTDGEESLKKQIPYWTQLLNADYGTLDYSAEVAFLKGIGYRIFRNSEGKHKIVYDEMQEI